MGIIIIEHKDLFFVGSIFKEKLDFAMFRYNKQDENLLMKIKAPESVFETFIQNDICLLHILLCVDFYW